MNHELKIVSIRLKEELSWFSSEPLNDPSKVVARMCEEFADFDREVFCILNLATDNKVINMNVVSVGTLNATLVSPREVFKSSVLSNAAGIIAVHNHVSGSICPSKEDELVTKKLTMAGKCLDIPLLDHIILGKREYFSFKECGLFDEKEKGASSLDMQIAQACVDAKNKEPSKIVLSQASSFLQR